MAYQKYARGGKEEVSLLNGIRRKMALFEQLEQFSLFTDSRCFKYSGSIDSLSRCYFILEHTVFRFSTPLFFFSSFLSRRIFLFR